MVTGAQQMMADRNFMNTSKGWGMIIWPFNHLIKYFKKRKEFKEKLAELKKRDPFDDADE
jgi:hypothetical protein